MSSDWPREEKIKILAQSLAGLFIWASTAVKFIAESCHPDQQLDVLLHPHPREVGSALDMLYMTTFTTAGQWVWYKVANDFHAVLEMITVAWVPLLDMTIDDMLSLNGL